MVAPSNLLCFYSLSVSATLEQSIFSEIHESKTFSTAFAFDSYLPLYLCVNGVAVSEVTDSQTDRQTDKLTDKLSTVTLAAHARRGLTRGQIPLIPLLMDAYVFCLKFREAQN